MALRLTLSEKHNLYCHHRHRHRPHRHRPHRFTIVVIIINITISYY
jgi:hypothetical protein